MVMEVLSSNGANLSSAVVKTTMDPLITPDAPSPGEADRLVELYQAAKDENELLEFKNYELMFKIQELEQNQQRILNKLTKDESDTSQHIKQPIQLDMMQTESSQNSQLASAPPTTKSAACVGARPVSGSPDGDIEEQQASAGHNRPASRQAGGSGVAMGELTVDGGSPTEARPDAVAPTGTLLSSQACQRTRKAQEDRDGDEGTRKSFSLAREHFERRHQQQQRELELTCDVGLDANHLGHESHMGGAAHKCASHDYLPAKHKTNKLANRGQCCSSDRRQQKQISGSHDIVDGDCQAPGSITTGVDGAADNNRHRSPIASSMMSQMGSDLVADCGSHLIEYKGNASDSWPALAAQQVGGDQRGAMKVMSSNAALPQPAAPLSVDIEKSNGDQDNSASMDTSQHQAHQAHWSKSQPNLSEVTKPRGGNARIAVPVSARHQPAGSGGDRGSKVSAPNHMLRVRSKSSLASSSLPRRVATRATSQPRCPQQPQQSSQLRQNSKLSVSSMALDQATSSSLQVRQDAKATGSTRCGSLLSARLHNRSNSSSSIGAFVTQIPSLISQSHAAGHSTGAPKTPAAGSSLPVCRNGKRVALGQPGALNSSTDVSKSMFNLADDSAQSEESSSLSRSPENKLAGELLSASAPEHQQVSKTNGTSTRWSESPPLGKLVGSKSVCSLALEAANEHSSSSYPSLPEATSLVCLASVEQAPTCTHDNQDAKLKVEPVDSETTGQSRNHTCEDAQVSSRSDEATHKADASQQRALQCAQCKLLQSKLILLIRDRKQLNEQLTELEEMENDSRLMSQKLAKQLSHTEQELELNRAELQRSCDMGAKMEFQNKRLNLELKLRLETIEKLKCQVKSLSASIASLQSHRHDTSGCNLNKTSKQVEQQASDTDDSGAGGSLESASTRRAPTSSCESQKKPVSQVSARPSERSDDSAYSTKSSASSCCDAHSDDGCRSSEDGEPARACFTSDQVQVELVEDANGSDKPSVSSASSSITSSGDESDHRADQGLSTLTLNGSAGANNQPSGRQQVLRKKISTSARSLRNQSTQRKFTDCSDGQGKAILARVVDEAEGAPSDAPTVQLETGCSSATRSAEPNGSKSFIELALEGVEELERGRTDEALRALIKTSARDGQLSGQAAGVACGESRPEDAGMSTRKQLSVEPAHLGSDMVNQLKLEISNLKVRLIHAHTLNDNLVAELKTNKEQLEQQRQQVLDQVNARSASWIASRQSESIGNYQPGKEQRSLMSSAGEQQLHKQRSIIHVNGSGISIANDSVVQQLNLQHQQQRRQSVQVTGSAGRQQSSSLVGANCSSTIDSNQYQPAEAHFYHPQQQHQQHQHQQQIQLHQRELHHCRHHHRTACVSIDELVEFLRFLLDKIHFHHGRTFELVSECQKLAMNALLASYSHQMNLLHHKSVVAAGEQLAGATGPSPQAREGSCPVRPPPRRRNPLNRMVSSGDNNSSLPSALQVAKQTLFSIVPIYHNNNSNSSQNKAKVRQPPPVESERPQVASLGQQTKASKGGWIILNRSDWSKANPDKHQRALDCSSIQPARSSGAVVELNDGCRSSSSPSSYKSNADNLHSVEPSSGRASRLSSSFMDAQHLLKVKSSLSEDIERYRVHFNGQLLDLLTRQNWCESIITEKVKSYQIINDRMRSMSAQGSAPAKIVAQGEQHIQVRLVSDSGFLSAVNLPPVETVASSQSSNSPILAADPATITASASASPPTSASASVLTTTSPSSMTKSVSLPINNISLNPNGRQTNQTWFNHDQSSYC